MFISTFPANLGDEDTLQLQKEREREISGHHSWRTTAHGDESEAKHGAILDSSPLLSLHPVTLGPVPKTRLRIVNDVGRRERSRPPR